jgi:hypothetical protein
MKKIIKNNFRLEIYPEHSNSDLSELEAQMLCNKILQQIKRYVGVNYTIFAWDQKTICEYCGFEWEWDEVEPECCQKAADEWIKINNKP